MGIRKIKPKKPKRSYRALIDSLSKVWKIALISQEEALWKMGAPKAQFLDPASIKIGVWNIFKGVGGHLFEHDFRRLLGMNDIFLVQEALLSEHSFRLYRGHGVEAIHAGSYKRTDGLRDGVMTLARVASHTGAKRILCKTPEPLLKTPKVALVSHYPILNQKDPLLVINVHATLFRTVKKSTDELYNLIGQIPQHTGPAVLAGDFNTFTPKYLTAVRSVLGAYGFRHVVIGNDQRSMFSNLDQVFVRGLEIKSSFVEYSMQSSDHFPLLVEFSL